jgi:hypothetical protein
MPWNCGIRTSSGETTALAQGELHDRDPIGLLEGLAQQHVGLGGTRGRFQVVGPLEDDRVDLARRHELHDLDVLAVRHLQPVELLVGDDDPPAGLVLEALADLGERHDLAARLAPPLVLDPPAVGEVHLVELHVPVLGRRVELDRDVDQPEGDVPAPHRAHGAIVGQVTGRCRAA